MMCSDTPCCCDARCDLTNSVRMTDTSDAVSSDEENEGAGVGAGAGLGGRRRSGSRDSHDSCCR